MFSLLREVYCALIKYIGKVWKLRVDKMSQKWYQRGVGCHSQFCYFWKVLKMFLCSGESMRTSQVSPYPASSLQSWQGQLLSVQTENSKQTFIKVYDAVLCRHQMGNYSTLNDWVITYRLSFQFGIIDTIKGLIIHRSLLRRIKSPADMSEDLLTTLGVIHPIVVESFTQETWRLVTLKFRLGKHPPTDFTIHSTCNCLNNKFSTVSLKNTRP